MILLFVIFLLLTIFFVLGFFFVLADGEPEGAFFLIPVALFLLAAIFIPIQRTEDSQIQNPDIVFNSVGAVVAYEGSNYVFKDYADVECLKENKMVPYNRKNYNYFNCVAYSEVILKPLDKQPKTN